MPVITRRMAPAAILALTAVSAHARTATRPPSTLSAIWWSPSSRNLRSAGAVDCSQRIQVPYSRIVRP
jgi:hypothetical protein